MNTESLGLIGLVAILLAAVLVFFLFSQRRLKANVQRIREEFGQPGERDLAIAQLTDAAGDLPTGSAESAAALIEQLDTKISQAHETVRAAEQQIARLEALIQRARQIGP